MKKLWKLWSIFTLAVILGTATNTVFSYYYHDPYEGIPCSECPTNSRIRNAPNPREECKACCSSQCEREEERRSCMNRCDQLPQP